MYQCTKHVLILSLTVNFTFDRISMAPCSFFMCKSDYGAFGIIHFDVNGHQKEYLHSRSVNYKCNLREFVSVLDCADRPINRLELNHTEDLFWNV